MKFKKAIVISTLLLCNSATLSLAQSPTSTDSAKVLRDDVKKKVQEELNSIQKAVAKRGYVGTITKKDDLTLTLTTTKGETRTVTLTTDSTVKLTGSKEGTAKDLKEKDFIIAMGDVDSTGILTAKRIVVTSKPDIDKREVIFGTITKATTSALTIETPTKETLTLKLTSETKTVKGKLSTLATGDKIIAIALPSSTKGTFTVKKISLVEAAPTPTPLSGVKGTLSVPTTKP